MCQSCPMRSFHVLALLRSATVIVSVPFVLMLKNNISLRLQLHLANAGLFSADEVAVAEGVAVVVKENFLRESFVCLASRHPSRIPSSTEKQVLFHAGLGMKIKLDLEDKEQDVLEKVTCGDRGEDGEIKGFPQLKESGGFEIIYCVTGVKELKPLNCSWAAKDLIGVTIQVVFAPIQKNFSTVSILPQNKSQVKEKCIICSKEVFMKDLRFHVLMSKTREDLLSSESEDDDTLSISVFASKPKEIQESNTSIATPSIPEASTLGQPDNANVSTRTAA